MIVPHFEYVHKEYKNYKGKTQRVHYVIADRLRFIEIGTEKIFKENSNETFHLLRWNLSANHRVYSLFELCSSSFPIGWASVQHSMHLGLVVAVGHMFITL